MSVNSINRRTVLDVFHDAEAFVKSNYSEELEDVYKFLSIKLSDIDKEFFFLQYIHVVYCSGFKYEIVVKHWNQIQNAYYNFDYEKVHENRDRVIKSALQIIRHHGKIAAILETASWLTHSTEEYFRTFLELASKKIETFESLPYIGKVTKYHLGLCMGFDVVKPDVHIQRLADHYGLDPFEMCETLSEQTGYPRRVVDAILWRASEQGRVRLSSNPMDKP